MSKYYFHYKYDHLRSQLNFISRKQMIFQYRTTGKSKDSPITF